MGNTWNGMYYTNIARMGINVFRKALIPLTGFTLDFSEDVREQGEAVTTRIVPASTAASDLQNDYTGNRTSAAEDTTTTSKTITLDQQPIVGFTLTDEEMHQIGSGVWQDTKTKLITNKLYALATNMLDYVFNLVTTASFANSCYTGSAAAFDYDDVVDIGSTLSTAGWPLEDGNTAMVLKPSYYGAVKKDSKVSDNSASGLNVVREGSTAIRQLDDFQLMRAPTLPPSGGTPESENLVGFVARPEAIGIAMRAVQSQATDDLLWFEVLTDPETGAVLVYRAWYDRSYGKVYHTFETLYGATACYGSGLYRMTSA